MKLLIIDDEPHIRHMMRLTLEGAGYQVDEAADGQTGLDRYRDGAEYEAHAPPTRTRRRVLAWAGRTAAVGVCLERRKGAGERPPDHPRRVSRGSRCGRTMGARLAGALFREIRLQAADRGEHRVVRRAFGSQPFTASSDATCSHPQRARSSACRWTLKVTPNWFVAETPGER